MTAEDLTDFLENAIDDSFDLGWTSRDAATLIVSRMQAEGLVMAPSHPAADLVEAAKEGLRQIEKYAEFFCDEDFDPTVDALRAALSRYAKGGA